MSSLLLLDAVLAVLCAVSLAGCGVQAGGAALSLAVGVLARLVVSSGGRGSGLNISPVLHYAVL